MKAFCGFITESEFASHRRMGKEKGGGVEGHPSDPQFCYFLRANARDSGKSTNKSHRKAETKQRFSLPAISHFKPGMTPLKQMGIRVVCLQKCQFRILGLGIFGFLTLWYCDLNEETDNVIYSM